MHRLYWIFCLFWKFPAYLTFEKSNNVCFVATWILYDKQATYICAIFLHWMGHLVTLVSSTLPRKKAFLAHVKVKAFETSVSSGEGRIKYSQDHSDIVLCKSIYLNPKIGFCLQMLHFAWCFAVSAAVNLQ